MKVSKYMARKLVTANKDDGAREAFLQMRRTGIRHLPVVDEAGALVGWITDRDLRRPDWADADAVEGFPWDLNNDVTVADLMTRKPIVVHTYDSVRKAVGLLVHHKFGAMPVLDKTGAIVGVLSVVDCLKAWADEMDISAEA